MAVGFCAKRLWYRLLAESSLKKVRQVLSAGTTDAASILGKHTSKNHSLKESSAFYAPNFPERDGEGRPLSAQPATLTFRRFVACQSRSAEIATNSGGLDDIPR